MRTRRLLALLALAALASPAAAQAHGGTRIATRVEGPYRIALDAKAVRSGQAVAVVDYTAYLRDARTGAPVDDARVRVVVQTPHGTVARPPAHRVGSTYETLIPVAHGDAWTSYRLSVRVDGPRGAVAFSYRPSAVRYSWPWRQPLVLGGALVALVLYLRAWSRLRRRGRRDHASLGRLAAYCAGVGLATLALVSPVDPIGERYLLSAHMLQHVLLGDSAPALILLGLRGPLSLHVVPRAVLRRTARLAWLRRAAAAIVRPSVALGSWAIAYAAWHVPRLYDEALQNQAVHDLEHVSFLVAGLLVWALLVDPLPHPRLDVRRRIMVALSLFALGTVLADTLIIAPHALYPAYADQPERLWGLSAVTDQRLAGVVMMLEQIVSVGICLTFLARASRGAQRGWRRRRVAA